MDEMVQPNFQYYGMINTSNTIFNIILLTFSLVFSKIYAGPIKMGLISYLGSFIPKVVGPT